MKVSAGSTANKRAVATRLIEEGVGCTEIAKQLEIGRQTVYRWKRLLQANGHEVLMERTSPGRHGVLTEAQIALLLTALSAPPKQSGLTGDQWSLKLVAKFINKTFAAEFGESGVSRLLGRYRISIKDLRRQPPGAQRTNG